MMPKFGSGFKNLKTMTKVMLGFAAVGVIIIVVGLVGVLGLQQVRNQLRIVYEHSTVALANLGIMSSNLGLYHDAVLKAGLVTTKAELRDAMRVLPELKRKTLEPFEAYASGRLDVTGGNPDEQQQLQALQKALEAYFSSAAGALSATERSFAPGMTDEQQAMMREVGWQALSVRVAGNYRVATLRVGALLTTVQEMAKGLNETGQAVAENRTRVMIAGVLVAIVLGLGIGYLLARSISRGISHIAQVAKQAAAGHLKARAHLDSHDELGQMGTAFNTMLDRITTLVQTEEERDMLQQRLREFLGFVSDVSKGDLTRRGAVTEDMFGNLADAFNLMVDRFSQLIREVKTSADRVNESSERLRNTAGQMAETSQNQTGESQRTLDAVEGLSQSMRQVSESAEASSGSAKQTLGATERGRAAIQDTLRDMQGIREAVQRLSKQVKSLGDRSLEISQIVSTIKDLASQTNLLALNAAIEAAGAGDAGARFAVVADEVHKLAESSTQATHEVANLVKVIQTETQDVVVAMERETQAVEAGSASALRSGDVFKEISEIAQRSSELAEAIAQSAKQQTSSTERVAESIWEFNSGAHRTQKSAEETRLTVEEMAKLASGLTGTVGKFKLN